MKWYQLSDESLLNLYDRGNTVPQHIADRFGVSCSTVQRRLKKLGVVLRKPSRKNLPPVEILWKLHHDDKKTLGDIGEKFGVSSGYIGNKLRGSGYTPINHCYVGIPSEDDVKNAYLECGRSQEAAGKRYGVSQTRFGKWMMRYNLISRNSEKVPIPSKEVVNDLYHVQMKSAEECGKLFQVTDRLWRDWLRYHGLPVRLSGRNTERMRRYSDEKVLELYERFGNYEKVALALGYGKKEYSGHCSTGAEGVRKVLHRLGVNLKSPDDYTTNIEIKRNYDFSYFLGAMLSEGSCSCKNNQYVFQIGVKDLSFLNKIDKLFVNLGLKVSRSFEDRKRKNPKWNDIYKLRAWSKNLCKWYMSLDKKKIIDFIGDNKDMMRGFLCAYHEADGHYSINGTICIASKDRWQLEVFDYCLKGLGYSDFYISKGYKNPNKPHWSEMFYLYIRRGKGEAEKFLSEMKPCIKCHGYYKDGR